MRIPTNRIKKVALYTLGGFVLFGLGVVSAEPSSEAELKSTQDKVVQLQGELSDLSKKNLANAVDLAKKDQLNATQADSIKQLMDKRVPSNCLKVIDIDNEIFTTTGNKLASYDFSGLTEYLNGKINERTAHVLGCKGGI